MYWRLVDRAAAALIKNQILYSALHYVFMIAGVVGFMGVCFSLLAFLEYGFSVTALIALIVCIALSAATFFFENVEKAIIRVQITVIGEEALNSSRPMTYLQKCRRSGFPSRNLLVRSGRDFLRGFEKRSDAPASFLPRAQGKPER